MSETTFDYPHLPFQSGEVFEGHGSELQIASLSEEDEWRSTIGTSLLVLVVMKGDETYRDRVSCGYTSGILYIYKVSWCADGNIGALFVELTFLLSVEGGYLPSPERTITF